MRNEELTRLKARLDELAEYYGTKAPSNAALKVWLDALRECHIDDVEFVLTDWPKTKQRAPLASEVLVLTRAHISDRIEAEAARNAREARKEWSVEKLTPSDPNSPAYLQFKRDFAEIMARPKPHPKAWMTDYLRRADAGENLPMVAEIRKIAAWQSMREPGEEG